MARGTRPSRSSGDLRSSRPDWPTWAGGQRSMRSHPSSGVSAVSRFDNSASESHYREVSHRRIALLLALGLALLGSSAGSTPPQPGNGTGTIQVVASTTVFADLVRTVAGEHATVTSLVP